MNHFLSTSIFKIINLKEGEAKLLSQELNIYTYEDLLKHYPFRYEDKTQSSCIADIHHKSLGVHLEGHILNIQKIGQRKKRLIATLKDATGTVELVWFGNFSWIVKKIQPGILYRVWGKPTATVRGIFQFVHPEVSVACAAEKISTWTPIYHTTDKLKKQRLDSRFIAALQKRVLFQLDKSDLDETLPMHLITRYRLLSLKQALYVIHFPKNHDMLNQANRRLKFEELFYLQLRFLKLRQVRVEKEVSRPFTDLTLFQTFYKKGLPFTLTEGQKRAIKDIYQDLKSGKQMNRLLQGDVGSGKTIVAFLAMLIVIASHGQVAIMAPTEILAKQHYMRLLPFVQLLNLQISLLTGSTKKKERIDITYRLKVGLLNIVVGTHALLSQDVHFKDLGFFVVDEQHRFGVAQRAGLSSKNSQYVPHILIMTATPIPRTLAMTFYGDLDVSTIADLPAGRKPIITQHYYENHRLRVFGFLKEQLSLGRQIYIVYPLIEESTALDYQNLVEGYQAILRAFPEFSVGMVHGKMDVVSKDMEMARFEQRETDILVSTTVIEVGISVPNSTVMVIENAEKFGLSQLHQLRGRIGRGNIQSYCILMTGYRLSQQGLSRIKTMVNTNDGFEIAELDLKLRGPGDVMGLKQSGALDLKIAHLGKDQNILEVARSSAKHIVSQDPNFHDAEHLMVCQEYHRLLKKMGKWSNVG